MRICSFELAQVDDVAVGVDVNVCGGWGSSKSGHGAHVAAERVDETGADAGADFVDREREALRGTLKFGVVRCRQMRLCDTDRQVTKP